jgi:hypothetical protein
VINQVWIHEDVGGSKGMTPRFLTSALDGGERSASRPGLFLTPWKEPSVPIRQKAGWTSEPVRMR